jgi:hypothetical protein
MSASDRIRADPALLAALAGGQTVEAAARVARVSERTARRRLGDPTFQRALADARRLVLGQALGVLTDAATAAARTLRALLDADADSIRLGAARAILDAAKQHVELDDIARRLEALEADVELERSAQELERQSQGRRRWGA